MSSWSELFSPVERSEIPKIEELSNSVHWFVASSTALLAIALFVFSANRSRMGDPFGAFLSAIAACVVALAPYLSTHFMIGG